MANAEADLETVDESRAKSGKPGLFIGVALAALLGGGAFYAVSSGMILGSSDEPVRAASEEYATVAEVDDVAFLPLEPIVVSLAPEAKADHLRFRAQLEVDSSSAAEVEKLAPRIVDVLNGYLRAVDPAELADPGALTMLRAQMLRRIQIVAGEGRVRDLLISEFVLN